jgi:hypothetical protein
MNLIYVGFGFTPLESIIYQLPGLAVTFSFVLGSAFTVNRWPRMRFPAAILTNCLACVSLLFAGLAPKGTDRWTIWGVFLFSTCFSIAMFMVWPLMSINVAGRTKKTWVTSTSLMTFCIGNVIGSQIFLPSDAPRYLNGLTGCAIAMMLNVVLMICWAFYYRWANKKRDAAFGTAGMTAEEQDFQRKLAGESDMTDLEVSPHTR